MSDRLFILKPPYLMLWFGLFFLVLGEINRLTGKATTRRGETVTRDKNPGKFWSEVVSRYMFGVFLIGYVVLKFSGLFN